MGRKLAKGNMTFEQCEKYTLKNGEPRIRSGRQELLENILNTYL